MEQFYIIEVSTRISLGSYSSLQLSFLNAFKLEIYVNALCLC